jgi:hypothetical protein
MDDILLKEEEKTTRRSPTRSGDGRGSSGGRIEEGDIDINSSQKDASLTVAIFYSISNMKRGLTGVDLGNNLIKRAAKELLAELPSLKLLATLSPLPGFASWVESTLTRVDQSQQGGKMTEEKGMPSLLLPEEKEKLLVALRDAFEEEGKNRGEEEASDAALLQHALKSFSTSPTIQTALKSPLLRLAAHYLLKEKHRGRALDSVANFHLRNGARMHRLNWQADTTRAGIERSYGIMVNYMYDMDAVEENNKKYIVEGEIAVSEDVEKLLEKC